MKVSGALVLYNPIIEEVIANINTYIDSLDVLYVYDNSDNGIYFKSHLENNFVKVVYYGFNENNGIACALNFIFDIAYRSGTKWMLTMDQDSSFCNNDIYLYTNIVEMNIGNTVALFSPLYPNEKFSCPQFYTSGSIVNLCIWHKIGFFDENLFIDEVDGDYTYRLKDANYKLIKIHEIKLIHRLGDKCSRRFLFKTIYSDNHSALRKYYIARNRIYLMKKRPEMRLIYLKDSLIKIVLFLLVERDVLNKFFMLFKGVYHGLINRMGKFRNT